ncbi:MAG: alanine racemase [Bacilli bacterium]|nr:alanine racemase [Bacilli bacterium]
MHRETYIEINLDKLCNNINNIINTFNDYQYYIGVIKGNAYGHGESISKYIIKNGINYLAVSTLEEALNIRKYIDNTFPILCLQPIDIKYIEKVIDNNITVCVSNIDYFNNLKNIETKTPIKFHLKLNTGMNRLGVNNSNEVKKIYEDCKSCNNLEFEGIFTHLCSSGVYDSLYYEQIKRFKTLTEQIDLSKIKIVHIGRSTTLDFHEKLDFCNGVRIGIMMYGISSTFPNNNGIKNKLRNLKYSYIRRKNKLPIPNKDCKTNLKQCLTLKSKVIEIQKVSIGDQVGYGSNNRMSKNGLVATIPIGYSDGLLTNYKNFYVKINSKKYSVIGTINMGMISVLVDENVKVGDIVTIIDENDNYKKIASFFNVSPYILMTSLNKNIPRIYIKDNKIVKE